MSARSTSLPILEKDIEKTCTEFLELDGWRSLKTEQNYNEIKRKVVGEKGMADRLFLRYGKYAPEIKACFATGGCACAEVLWVEFKRQKNNGKATTAGFKQQEWHKAERARGALTVVAGVDFPATIEGFMVWYCKSGLARSVRS